jgi:hypothetical protein
VEHVRFFALRIIDGLCWDVERRGHRKVLSRRELDAYYSKVVLAPAELGHIVLGARVASSALQEISGIIGRLQSVRDLNEDWIGGLINIPAEEIEHVRSTNADLQRERIVEWRVNEVERCSAKLRVIWNLWPRHADERSRVIMNPAVSSLFSWQTRLVRGQENIGAMVGQLLPVC